MSKYDPNDETEEEKQKEERIQKTVKEIMEKRNALPTRIGEVKGESKKFADWIVDLDYQMQIDIDFFKHTKQDRKYDYPIKRTIKVPHEN